jgi:hypothetical protein
VAFPHRILGNRAIYAEKSGSTAYPKYLQARAQVNEMMDWFNAYFYKAFGHGFIYPQLYPHRKRANDPQQAGAISRGKKKALHWQKILGERLIGPHNNCLCGVVILPADYQVSEIIHLAI